MDTLTGKTLIFTDIHFGINSDKPSRQKIAESIINELTEVCEINSIQNIIFLGDLFHHRTSIEVSTLNLAYRSLKKLSGVAELWLIQGNHDLYEKSGRSLSSTGIFADRRIHVIAVPTEITINGQSTLLVPWCGDGHDASIRGMLENCGLTDLLKRYDILMGHFNLSDGNEIERELPKIKGTILKNESSVYGLSGDIAKCDSQASELFAMTKPLSHVFLGHIHEHQEVVCAKRLFHVVGSPQMQVHDLKGLDPNRKLHGYYILNESNIPEFHETKSAPKFVTVYASEIKSPTRETEEKLKSLKGCIIKRCYDCNLSDEEQKKFDSTINESAALEEDSAVFTQGESIVREITTTDEKTQQNALYGVSKQDFLKSMSKKIIIENNEANLSDEEIEKQSVKVYEKLLDYYNSLS